MDGQALSRGNMQVMSLDICKLLFYAFCTEGWVNLYKKFEIEKYTVCGKLIFPKKWKDIF